MAKAIKVDYLIVGAGVAGLRAAVELASHGEVLVVTKESLGESNTYYAQGGIAVATDGNEDVALHLEDTVNAGDGIVCRTAAEALVTEGPLRVEELIRWGANFDREAGTEGHAGRLLRTLEGAHALPRILHSQGDATGAEISRSLVAYARSHPRICFGEWTMVTGLVTEGGRVVAADLAAAGTPSLACGEMDCRVSARSILIASGGAGQVYSNTTNPAVATGDGIALAALAGAELADMEFYQFHPTAISLPDVPRFLLSEALRGEGAWLRNSRGERFMERYHPLLELAPRDIVARAIAREAMPQVGQQESSPVYLDMRHVRGANLGERFPGISAFLAQLGLDLRRDLIPVRPAAHYLMGGIRTDLGGRPSLGGRTSLRGLYAAGEAACTGVHGANRLASNSLLEGLVFGARAAQSMLADGLPSLTAEAKGPTPKALSTAEAERVAEIVAALQYAMWAHAGLLRDDSTLRQGLAAQSDVATELADLAQQGKASRRLSEAQSLSCVAHAILRSALARIESRGAHFRNDHPHRDDVNFQKHSILGRDGQLRFEAW